MVRKYHGEISPLKIFLFCSLQIRSTHQLYNSITSLTPFRFIICYMMLLTFFFERKLYFVTIFQVLQFYKLSLKVCIIYSFAYTILGPQLLHPNCKRATSNFFLSCLSHRLFSVHTRYMTCNFFLQVKYKIKFVCNIIAVVS